MSRIDSVDALFAPEEAAVPPKGAEAIRQLRSALDRAANLAQTLERNLDGSQLSPPGGDRVTDLERQLEAAEADREELATQLVEAEHQAGKLMNLYVATYQLHATLDATEVQETIAEIAINLLGAERFVLLLKDDTAEGCEIGLAMGAEDDPSGLYVGDRYVGGDPLVDATLDDGSLRIGRGEPGETAVAAVPLRVEDVLVGALVILKLLDHKVTPLTDDRDLLDLLAAHAATALFAARVYSNADRKLRTLESLVKLIRGT